MRNRLDSKPVVRMYWWLVAFKVLAAVFKPIHSRQLSSSGVIASDLEVLIAATEENSSVSSSYSIIDWSE